MPRATNSAASRKRRKRMLERAKGFRANRSKLYRYAKDAVYKAEQYATRDRQARKRAFRRLWIQRISAACKQNDILYSRFIAGLAAANIALDRKVLADLAMNEPESFRVIVARAKDGLKQQEEERAKAAA